MNVLHKFRQQSFSAIAIRNKTGRLHGLFVNLVLLSGLFISALVATGHGAVPVSGAEVLAIIGEQLGLYPLSGLEQQSVYIISEIRLPRVVLAMLVGAALAVSGTAMQGLFRNPLADPALIGISSGSALVAAAVIASGWVMGDGILRLLSLPIAAFIGGLLTTWFIYRLATVEGTTSVASMLLAGIAFNALAGAGTGLFSYFADDATLRSITFWTMGSLGGANWQQVMVVAPILLAVLVLLPLRARALNVMLLGEAEAGHLGFRVQRVKQGIVVLVALAVGTAVSISGIIGFVGLVVPHLLRLTMGPDHRFLMPASIFCGALLLLLADLLARTLVSPAELPIGIVTAIIGSPFFLWLLWQQRKGFAQS